MAVSRSSNGVKVQGLFEGGRLVGVGGAVDGLIVDVGLDERFSRCSNSALRRFTAATSWAETFQSSLPEFEQRSLDQPHHSRRELNPVEKLPEHLFEALGAHLDGATFLVPVTVVAQERWSLALCG